MSLLQTDSRPRLVVSGNPRNYAETLYEQNRDLLERGVLSVCGCAGLRPDQWEEAFSAARLGLWNAATRFDPARGAAFPTFARWHIRGEMSHYLRALVRTGKLRDRELDAPLIRNSAVWKSRGRKPNTQGEDGGTLLDTLPDDPQTRPGASLLAETGFEALVEALPPRQEACVRRLYQDDEPLTSLAEEWGVSRAAVSAMHLRALTQCRQSLQQEDWL